jgi:predicted secreted hydrolase
MEGYSVRGKDPQSASCYYSFTRLEASGRLALAGKSAAVTGTAWMDHEYGSAPLEDDLTGWDWFSIQLNNETELMIYLLRQKQGGYSPASSGTYVFKSGRTVYLSFQDFEVNILARWKSHHSKGRYPSRWRIRVLPVGLDLQVVPNLADQELTTEVVYWEGSVSVSGKLGNEPVKGMGYVEMTGYAEPFRLSE